MTEKEKMLAGELYSAVDPQLLEELGATRKLTVGVRLRTHIKIQYCITAIDTGE